MHNPHIPSQLRFDPGEAAELLQRTPLALSALLHGLPAAWTDASEGPDTFSPFDVLGHLIHGERTDWIPRARIIIAQGAERRFEPYDRFAQNEASRGRSMRELLETFEQLRNENIATLRGFDLSERTLSLTGDHPALGTVTLHQLLSAWVVHDLGHIAQITRVMAKRYRDDVGPWTEYLTILNR